MKQLYINGIGTGQYNIFISSDTFLNSPEIAYEAYEVPSLDGSLLKYDKRLNNVARRFDCFCKTNVKTNIDAFKKMLYSNRGYLRIESDYEPDVYQLGYLAEGIEFQPFDQSGAFEVQFSLYFSCMPQKFFKANPEPVTPTYMTPITKLTRVIPRESEEMQAIIKQVGLTNIPDADFYAVFALGEVTSSSSTLTNTFSNFTATNHTGGFVCLYARCLEEYYYESGGVAYQEYYYAYHVVGYADGTITPVSGSRVYKTASNSYVDMYALVPVTIGMGVSVSGSWQGTARTLANNTAEIAGFTDQYTQANASGVSITLRAQFSWVSATAAEENEPVPCAIYICGMMNGEVTSECIVDIHFEQMPDTLRKQLSSYMVNNMLTVDITTEFDAYVLNSGGTRATKVTDYLDVRGSFDFYCDTLKYIIFYAQNESTDYGAPRQADFKTVWWML